MPCKNCDPKYHKPGRLVRYYTDEYGDLHCDDCKDIIHLSSYQSQPDTSKWDSYFHSICQAVATKSPCLSRKIGALLVRDHSIVSTGYNGPPRGVPHCGHERIMKDGLLGELLGRDLSSTIRKHAEFTCPRRLFNYASGTHMELCPAQHAEVNAISNAARLGVSILGTTLYMNCVIPCKNCYGALINAGIVEIVVDETTVYDKHTQFLIDNSDIKIRSFQI